MAKFPQPYDRRYFDKWYRDPAHRVSSRASAARKAAIAIAVAEYYLERPVRTVLDVACGEGQWQPILTRLRPRLRYTGVDSSAYAVERFGRRRNLQKGGFGELDQLDLASSYDLIVCSDALFFLPPAELLRGLAALVPRLGGIAFLELYGREEPLEGDIRQMRRLTGAEYRRILRRFGLVSCGPHCYAGTALSERVTDFERGQV